MKITPVDKKLLIIALTEDLLFIVLFTVLFTSALEVLLPGSIIGKTPLALVFSVFALLMYAYITLLRQENLPLKIPSFSRVVLITSGLTLLLTTALITRDFGILGTLAHFVLLVLIAYFAIKK